MGIKEFQIILDSPVYYAGQNLTGKLLVVLKKPKKIKGVCIQMTSMTIKQWETIKFSLSGIYIKYFGRGIVQWCEGWGTSTVTHSNTEIYLTEYQLVYGSE